MCREVASLRTTLQSKNRQLQEFMNSHERAQTFHHRWEKVRIAVSRETEYFKFMFTARTHIANDATYPRIIFL